MKFIELNNTKLKFFDSESPYISYDGIVNINPFLVEVVAEKYLHSKDQPFVARIKLSSGRYYDVRFSSTFERNDFIEKVKAAVFDCYKCCDKK